MRILASLIALLLLSSGTAFAQYFPDVISVQGDASPDGLGTLENLDTPNISASGVVAFTADDNFVDDDILIIGSTVFIREGAAVAGSGGGTLDLLGDFESQRQLNAAGDVVFESTGLDIVPTTADNVLHLNGAKLLQEGDPVDGVPGRLFVAFLFPSIADNGDVYCEIDVDVATTDDEILYVVPFGGVGGPLAMNAGSVFREGSLIVGGPLDGRTWDLGFNRGFVNGPGSFIVEGNVDGATTDDEVLIRKQAGLDYEILLREGDLFTTPIGGLSAPIESITDHSIADNNDWAVEVFLSDLVVGTAADEAILASFGGAAATIIAQESQDISAITGITGTAIGLISGAIINSNGRVLFLASVLDPVVAAPYDEALFLWEAGVLTLVLTDNTPVPAVPGESIGDIIAGNICMNDQNRIIFEASLTPTTALDGIFEAIIPAAPPVESLACTGFGDQIDATWTIPAGTTYTGIRIYLDGALETTLAGSAVSYLSPPFAVTGNHELSVEPFIGVDVAPDSSCTEFVVVPPDFIECSTTIPPPAIDETLPPVADVLNVVTNVAIDELTLQLGITHTYQGDLDIDLVSPLGTQVFLTTDNGSTNDNVDITFADFGPPMTTSTNLALGGYVRPEGPGTMADFICEFSVGGWTLNILDDGPGDVGTLDQWCLNIYENPAPGLDCCPQRNDLLCSNVGACGPTGVNLSWTNNFSYNDLELVRSDGVNPDVTIPLLPAATSYSDSTVVTGTTYTYTLRYQCAVGGPIQDSFSCVVAVNSTDVPPAENLVCTADPCGTGDVSLTWTNGATYSSLTLNRAGLFLADVTGLSSFVDTAPLAGNSTYSLVAACGGSTATTNCLVANAPPPVTGVVCDPNFCASTVLVTWNTGGFPYTQLTLNRAGLFLADVTGMTSFTDTAPPAGISSVTYSVVGSCGGTDSVPASCVANLELELPADLLCSAPVGSEDVTLTWTNPIPYTSIQILREGVPVTPQPAPGATTYVDPGLAQGAYTYTIIYGCPGGTDSLTCTVGVITGNEFLLVGRDLGLGDGIALLDPTSGDFLATFVAESTALELYEATNAVVGPRVPGGDLVVYLSDSVGIDFGSVVRYELDGTFIGQYIDDTVYDDVRGIEFQGDTLYLTSTLDDVVIAWDIGTLSGTTFIATDAPTDLHFLPSGQVLIASSGTDTVTLYDSAGLNPVVLVSSANSTITNPNQIAPLSNGNFVVGTENAASSEIIEFTLAGTVVQSFPIGFIVKGVYELPNGLVLFTTDAGTGIFTLDRGTGIVTNIYDDVSADFYYIERVAFGPVVQPDQFVRGNANNDASVNIADAIYLLGNLFPAGGSPNPLVCLDAADANDDGLINIADAISLLTSLFGSPAIPLPAPNTDDGCGVDPTDGDALDCVQFDACP